MAGQRQRKKISNENIENKINENEIEGSNEIEEPVEEIDQQLTPATATTPQTLPATSIALAPSTISTPQPSSFKTEQNNFKTEQNFDDEIFKIFEKCRTNDIAPFLIGSYGIGKSARVKEYAEELAKKMGRKFIEWHTLSNEEKADILSKPEELKKYYILIDIKLSTVGDPSGLIGLPILKREGGTVVYEPPEYIKLVTNPNFAGILFLDEVNMAPRELQALVFEMLLQKKIFTWKISDNTMVIAAGNDPDSNALAMLPPSPVINRVFLLTQDRLYKDFVKSWLDWATKSGIDPRIIAYVQLYKHEALGLGRKDDTSTIAPKTTPRSWELLSKLIKGVNDIDTIRDMANGVLSSDQAAKFVAFVADGINLMKYPLSVKTLQLEVFQKNPYKQFAFLAVKIPQLLLSNNPEDIKEIVQFLKEFEGQKGTTLKELYLATIRMIGSLKGELPPDILSTMLSTSFGKDLLTAYMEKTAITKEDVKAEEENSTNEGE